MLKIIGRVLKLSGNLSGRIWGSFVCGFLDAMLGMLPIAAMFYVLMQLHDGAIITPQIGRWPFRSF
jgi:ATP-binding cassette subfamily B protein